MDDLDNFLKSDEAPTVEAEAPAPEATEAPAPEATETVEQTQQRQRDEKGRFAPKGETESASPAPTEATLDHAALIGERRRRQEAEARIAEYEARLAQYQAPQQQQAQPEGPPDRWEDPEGYDRWLVNQAAVAAREEATQAFNYQRIQAAAAQFQADKPDYQEVIGVFGQMANYNPSLISQMQQAPNPAEFAYRTAKTQLEISQHGGLDGLINARVQQALQTQAPPPAQQTPIPETLAGEQSARGSSGVLHVPSLDDILKR